MHSVDKSLSSGEYCHLRYWVHTLIRHYLTTGRKYALIKNFALNKHVCLLTRLYSMCIAATLTLHSRVLGSIAIYVRSMYTLRKLLLAATVLHYTSIGGRCCADILRVFWLPYLTEYNEPSNVLHFFEDVAISNERADVDNVANQIAANYVILA